MKRFRVAVLIAAGTLPVASAALSASPGYVGNWSGDPYTCRPGNMVSLTTREMHLLENGVCRFDRIRGGAGRWHVAMTCEGEGSIDHPTADLVLKGDFLFVAYGKAYDNRTVKFKRCDASAASLERAAAPTESSGPASPWAGHYARRAGSYRWEATISDRGRNLYKVDVSVASQMPLCSGDMSAPARSVGGKLLVTDEDCRLTISRDGARGIRIDEGQCNAHGVACGFSSTLTRK